MITTKRRFKRASNKEKLYKFLRDKTNIFLTYAEIFVFLISLGVRYRKKKPLEDNKLEPIAYTSFSDDAINFMNLVVLMETQDINSLILSDEESVKNYMKIVEEYANGGAEILLPKLEIHPENSYEILLNFLEKEINSQFPDFLDKGLFED